MAPLSITKPPGWNWLVFYLDEDDDGKIMVEAVSVFGQMTPETAMQEARWTFADEDMPEFVGLRRMDQDRDLL
jgi:hypothetical protein